MIETVWPYAALAGMSFLAATILPLSSEALLVAQLATGIGHGMWLVVAATVGNVAGSLFNWWMGGQIRRFEGRRWFPFKPEQIAAATERFNRFGVWVLLFAWVPVVGDPLTIVAGVLRVPLGIFLPLVAVGKAARYALIAWFV